MENVNDMLEVEDQEFEQRLRAYYVSQYGDGASTSIRWKQVVEQLGEQEVGAQTNIGGGVSANTNTTLDRVDDDSGTVGLPGAKRQSKPVRFSWSLAIAATAILALGGLLVGYLGFGRGLDAGNLLGQKEQVIFSEGFESGLEGWTLSGNQSAQYKEGIDNSTFHSGGASTYIESSADEPNQLAWRGRVIDVKDYLDKRIRFSAYVKRNSDDLTASLGMIVYGEPITNTADQSGSRVKLLGKDDMSDRVIRGTADWQRYDIVLDVPPDAKDIAVYFQVEGKGRVWFDDVTLSVANGDVPVTNMYRSTEVENAGFEQELSRWGISSFMSRAYEWGTDSETKYEGNASGVISSTVDRKMENTSFYFSQFVSTADYKGKTVRVSAQIKTENVQDEAALWVGIRDLADHPMSPDTIGTDKSKGTTDWRKYQAEINVPEDSLYFHMFIGLSGNGKMWVDDVKFEVVGDYGSTAPTPALDELTNANFESDLGADWNMISPMKNVFVAATSSEQAHTGNQSAYLRASEKSDETGSLQQTIRADQYRGKVIAVSAWVKADKAPVDSFLWAEIYTPNLSVSNGNPLHREAHLKAGESGYDGGWKRLEVGFVVPTNAETITLGVKLKAEGEAWVDDFAIEIK
jgi:mannose-6-phosphate isomerase-like protein (cupin superfamily)